MSFWVFHSFPMQIGNDSIVVGVFLVDVVVHSCCVDVVVVIVVVVVDVIMTFD